MKVLKEFAKKTKGKVDIKPDYFKRNWEKVQKAKATKYAENLMKEIGVYDYMKKTFGSLMKESKKVVSFLEYIIESR